MRIPDARATVYASAYAAARALGMTVENAQREARGAVDDFVAHGIASERSKR